MNAKQQKELSRIYKTFLKKVRKIEAERDKKIMAIIKEIDERQLKDIRSKI